MDIVWFILIGLCAGWLAGRLMGTGGQGLLGDLVVGIVGALVGGLLFQTAGIMVSGGLLGGLIVATVGAIALISGLRIAARL